MLITEILLYSRIWDPIVSHCLKQWIWSRNSLRGGRGRRTVLCQKRWRRHCTPAFQDNLCESVPECQTTGFWSSRDNGRGNCGQNCNICTWTGLVLPHSWGSKAKASNTFACHAVLSCAVLTHSATDSLVQSLMSSVQRLPGLPRFLVPAIRPWRMEVQRSSSASFTAVLQAQGNMEYHEDVHLLPIKSPLPMAHKPSQFYGPNANGSHSTNSVKVCPFVCLRFNGTFSTNRLYCAVSCRGRTQHK